MEQCCSQSQPALSAKTPVHAAIAASDAGDMLADVLLDRWLQGTSLKPSPSSIMAKRPEESAERLLYPR